MDGEILELQKDLGNGAIPVLMKTIELAARERLLIQAEETPFARYGIRGAPSLLWND